MAYSGKTDTELPDSQGVTSLYLKVRRMEYMDPYNFSDMRRELDYQKFMIRYLQEEQKKRWGELDQIKKDFEILKNDPKLKTGEARCKKELMHEYR